MPEAAGTASTGPPGRKKCRSDLTSCPRQPAAQRAHVPRHRAQTCLGGRCFTPDLPLEVSSVDGESCCLRPGPPVGTCAPCQGTRPERSEGEWLAASRPVVAALFRALEGAVLKTCRNLSGEQAAARADLDPPDQDRGRCTCCEASHPVWRASAALPCDSCVLCRRCQPDSTVGRGELHLDRGESGTPCRHGSGRVTEERGSWGWGAGDGGACVGGVLPRDE